MNARVRVPLFLSVLCLACGLLATSSVLRLVLSTSGGLAVLLFVSWQTAVSVVRTCFRMFFSPLPTTDKCILVSGGQSELGTAVVTRLCDAGFRVFACFPEGDCSSFASALKAQVRHGSNLTVVTMDRKERGSIDACLSKVRECVTAGQQMWGVVTFSAFPLIGPIDWSNFDPDFKQVVDGDIIGLLHLVRECLPILRQSKGRIVNVTGSPDGGKGLPIRCTAAISRSTSRSLMECVRREVAYFGIHVINVDADSGLHRMRDPADGLRDASRGGVRPAGTHDLRAVADCVEQGLRSLFPEYKYRVSSTSPTLEWFRSLLGNG